MSKITFRADDDLVERLDGFEASKSEVMREALRAHLDGAERGGGGWGADDPDAGGSPPADSPIDDALRERVDALIAERVDALVGGGFAAPAPEVSLTVNVEGVPDAVSVEEGTGTASDARGRRVAASDDGTAAAPGAGTTDCAQCGEALSDDHVYCPNCGEKASRRLFCDCGDEVRSDWAFCPSCGRRTPAADVLDGGEPQDGGP